MVVKMKQKPLHEKVYPNFQLVVHLFFCASRNSRAFFLYVIAPSPRLDFSFYSLDGSHRTLEWVYDPLPLPRQTQERYCR